MGLAGAFDVEGDHVSPGRDVLIERREGVVDHQVDVLEQPGLHRPDDGRTDRQHRTEDAVHDIDVDELDAGRLEDHELVAEVEQVGRDHPDRQVWAPSR